MTKLSDGLVTIKPFTHPEYAPVHFVREDEELIHWLNNGIQSSPEHILGWIEYNQDMWERNGPVHTFAIEVAGLLVGMVEADMVHILITGIEKGEANISYGIYREARGNGYAPRAVHLLLRFLEENTRVKRAVIRANPDNSASQRVAKKCGFTFTEQVQNEDGEALLVLRKPLSENRRPGKERWRVLTEA